MKINVCTSLGVLMRSTGASLVLLIWVAVSGIPEVQAASAITVVITSPADGTKVAPGSTIDVAAKATSADPSNPVSSALVVSSVAGATLVAPGYTASLTLPANYSGVLTLTAFAKNSQTFGQSTPVSVLVTPNDTLSSLTASPSTYTFVTLGAIRTLDVIGTFAGGETADVSDHRLGTTYQSSATNVATVSADGLVTAVGNGAATINIQNGSANATVAITVSALATNSRPLANAGSNQTVAAGDVVTINGTQSTDPNEQPLAYAWTQISGPAVTLDNNSSATPSFIAPNAGGILQFSLKVTDFSGLSSAASTSVAVSPCGTDPNHPCAGLPVLTSTITLTGTQGAVAYADWTLSNSGHGPARSLTLGAIVPSVLSGTGSVTLDPTLTPILPAVLPVLDSGSSTTERLFFNFPSTVTRFNVTESGTYADATGTIHAYSMTQIYGVVSSITVPNVVGLMQAAASSAITGAGLVVGTVTTQSSATVAAGLVISESPIAGTSVAAKSAVNLVVSSGPAPVKVPNVVGATQASASTVITSAALVVGSITAQSSATIAAGLVISESPIAGTSVAAKSAVNLVVSSGPAPVKVPNVVGATQASASTVITSAGLVVGSITAQSSATIAAGLVVSESPIAGTSVAAKSAVNLVVSSGPAPVKVPNVVGATQASASTVITSAGLVVGSITAQSSATIAAGLVIGESPIAGTSVAASSTVNLVVSSGAAPVAVPNVVGLTQAAASSAITGAGLVVGTVTTQSSATVAAGLVISESPLAGRGVAAKSQVSLVVSSGAATVAVPNVVGVTQAIASSSITTAGLILGNVTNTSSATFAAGLVVSENPVAGSKVAPKSAINLVVSTGPLIGDVNGDGVVNCADLGIVKASFGKSTGQLGFDARADVNHDGKVNIVDLSTVSRAIPVGSSCN